MRRSKTGDLPWISRLGLRHSNEHNGFGNFRTRNCFADGATIPILSLEEVHFTELIDWVGHINTFALENGFASRNRNFLNGTADQRTGENVKDNLNVLRRQDKQKTPRLS